MAEVLEYQPPPPRPIRTAGPLALLILINLFNYVDRQVLAAIEKPISEQFNATQAMMGWLVTAFLLVYMVFAPLFGWWADRFSKWKLIGFSMILQSLASGGSGLAQTYVVLLIMRCAVGIGEAAWGPAAPSLLSDMYPVERRGKILSFFYAAIPVGSALGYAVGGMMIHLTGQWQWAFYVLMPPGVLIGIACFFFKDPPRAVGYVAPTQASAKAYVDLFRIPSFSIACIGMTLMTFALGGIAFWMPRYLQVDRGLGTNSTIIFGGIAAASGLVATIVGGAIGDKLRKRFSGSYFYVSAAGMLLGFPLFLWLLSVPNGAWHGPLPYAWGILFAAIFCLFLNTGPGNAILANVAPTNVRSRAFALNIFVIHLFGDAISPPLIGAIADHSKTAASSGIGVGFFWVSIMMAVGGAVWWSGARFLEKDTIKANLVEAAPGRAFEVMPKPATMVAP
jgi:MFS transporter, Spinster family, sphingosine-1-phosphate transporter